MTNFESTYVDIPFSFAIASSVKYQNSKKQSYLDYRYLQEKTRYDHWLNIVNSASSDIQTFLLIHKIKRKTIIVLGNGEVTIPVYIKGLEQNFLRLQSIVADITFTISYNDFEKYIIYNNTVNHYLQNKLYRIY